MGKKKSFVFYYDWRDILEPFDDVRLARLIRAVLKFAVDGEESSFDDLALTVSYNFIVNAITRDSEKYSRICEKRKEIGKLGGEKKRDNNLSVINDCSKNYQLVNENIKTSMLPNVANLPDNDNDNDNVNDTDTDNVNDNEINIPSFSSKTVCEYTDDFLKFWKEYPKKVGKGEAYKQWKKARISSDILNDMLEALRWQKRSDTWKKKSGQYIPNPSTYISQRRWEDEPMGLGSDITDPMRYNDGDELPEYILRGDI